MAGLGDIRRALRKAGMSANHTKRYARFIDGTKPLDEQIISLAEDAPDLFRLDDEDYVYDPPGDDTDEDDEQDEDERPMTAAEAKLARLNGAHRLAPTIPGRPTAAERNAEALGALRERHARPSHAPATATAAADRLRLGIGRSADGES
ncbi:hypothetical protein P1P68_05535 [Streptomyces scabiei]|uniref:hypothetical protein n=1 Tax=Streptomyces scabiei TaxID=1930 RepID=UPI0029900632|nr:hypothetical protein [Streptomyces scabiei]MDW8804265.1 hypothetical protein [Streptomyces scabiei]